MKNMTFKVFKYPKQKIIHQIANEHGTELADKVIRGMNSIISRAKQSSDHFAVVAFDVSGKVVGYAGFIQSSKSQNEWLYTDLWVKNSWRRSGVATAIINKGIRHLLLKRATNLLCTVSPDNHPSLSLQKKLGFECIETRAFEFLDCEGLVMFNKSLRSF